MKFLAAITNQKIKFWYIYGRKLTKYSSWNIESLHNILIIFGIKEKCIILPYNVLLSIATNIHVLLMTAFVLQGHI